MVSVDSHTEGSATRSAVDRAGATDFAIALTAGPNAWVTPDSASTPMVRAGLSLALIGLTAMASAALAEIAYQDRGRSLAAHFAMSAATIVSLATLAVSAVAALRRQQHHGGRQSMRLWRIGALMVFCTIWISTVSPAASILIWPLGLFTGVEAALTARLIGHDRRTRTLYRDYMISPLHLGAVTAVLVWAIAKGTASFHRVALTCICSLEVAALAAVVSYGVIRKLFMREAQFSAAVQLAERTEEFHRLAHWIHDDVCADLREIRVKMASQTLDHVQISHELDHLDDRLRERQLDEMLNSGAVSAAEIIQSYVRRAQNAGVRIEAVPRFEEASVMLAGEPARLLRRCAAGFVANAVAAGTTVLGFQLEYDNDDLVLEVTDNAGGFELASAPSGRGLASLAAELGSHRLTSRPAGSGTTMMARIPLK